MDLVTAVMIADGGQDADEETQREAWQHLIDTGVAWELQGSIGRMADRLIERGVCQAPGASDAPAFEIVEVEVGMCVRHPDILATWCINFTLACDDCADDIRARHLAEGHTSSFHNPKGFVKIKEYPYSVAL